MLCIFVFKTRRLKARAFGPKWLVKTDFCGFHEQPAVSSSSHTELAAYAETPSMRLHARCSSGQDW